MNKQTIFDIWAPMQSVWSKWAKPVVFAHMDIEPPPISFDQMLPDVSWVPPASERCALVLDLPCEQGVAVGLQLAALGYRPVPLYNAIPHPSESVEQYATPGFYPVAVVQVEPILRVLWHGAAILRTHDLPADAPPAFLLDCDRSIGRTAPVIGSFDNRSISFPSDFPSANLLFAQGIKRAVLVQPGGTQPLPDLSHTLLRWQEAGVVLDSVSLLTPGKPIRINVTRPSRFRALWYRILALAGFRRQPLGGFGGIIPDPSSAG